MVLFTKNITQSSYSFSHIVTNWVHIDQQSFVDRSYFQLQEGHRCSPRHETASVPAFGVLDSTLGVGMSSVSCDSGVSGLGTSTDRFLSWSW